MPPSSNKRGSRVFASLRSPAITIPAPHRAGNTICVSEFLNGDIWATMPSAAARRMSISPSVASTATTKPSTAERNIDNVVLGNIMFRAWYPSYHVKEIIGKEVVDGKKEMLERLYVCNHCFKYSKELMNWVGHVRVCERRLGGTLGVVPGRKIYTHEKGTWSVWEVDGEVDTVSLTSINGRTDTDNRQFQLYCQNLSLFAKLFLDNKSVFFDVTGFYYFLLVHTKTSGEQQVIGFFSKEKMSWDNNNLACILIFPPWQRKGLGALLIGVSYEISRREEIMGGPEKPISNLGKQSYLRFWSGEIARYLLSVKETDRKKGKGMITLEQISKDTWICVDDCLSALRHMSVAVAAGKGKGEVPRVRIDKEKVREWAESNGVGLEPVIDVDGFLEGYGYK